MTKITVNALQIELILSLEKLESIRELAANEAREVAKVAYETLGLKMTKSAISERETGFYWGYLTALAMEKE